jgi:hypothetical protein
MNETKRPRAPAGITLTVQQRHQLGHALDAKDLTGLAAQFGVSVSTVARAAVGERVMRASAAMICAGLHSMRVRGLVPNAVSPCPGCGFVSRPTPTSQPDAPKSEEAA